MRMVTRACQSCTSILVTLPTLTSATRTRVFCWMITTSGNCAWMVYEPSPPPSVPGRLSELRPRHSQPGIADRHATTSAAASMRLMACPGRGGGGGGGTEHHQALQSLAGIGRHRRGGVVTGNDASAGSGPDWRSAGAGTSGGGGGGRCGFSRSSL